METQSIYLLREESENTTPCTSPDNQLPNKFPDSHERITQLIASQHEQMSASGNVNLQKPITPPTSLISEHEEKELFAPIVSNPTQNARHVPARRYHPIQMCQQLTPISETPELPTPENRVQRDIFCPCDLPDTPTTPNYHFPSVSTVIEQL